MMIEGKLKGEGEVLSQIVIASHVNGAILTEIRRINNSQLRSLAEMSEFEC